jgi:hypothetical protein
MWQPGRAERSTTAMASTTGIELGPDSCVLAGVRPARKGVADVTALHIIEPSSWPSQDVALAEMLRSVRRGKRFPRTARVVAWGLSDRPTLDDPITRSLLRPITAAGFRVASILTPPQALALLAATRPRSSGDGAIAWLTLNVHAVAIAIISRGELVFSRTFGWSYNSSAMSGKAQLLQRYSLVAQLAPEVHRGIAAVRASHGITVDAVVTCGDLPELRSLTMPLIEELDMEVETLDSTEGLRAVGKARFERFAESAPGIRLACAAALALPSGRESAVQSLMRSAAAIGIIAALAWAGYTYWRAYTVRPVTVEHAAPPSPAAAPGVRRGPPAQTAAGKTSTPAAANARGKEQIIAQGPPTTPARSTLPTSGQSPAPAVNVQKPDPKPLPPAPATAEPRRTSAPPKVESRPVPSATPKVEPAPPPRAQPKVEPRPAPPAQSKIEPKPTPPPPPRIDAKPLRAAPATAQAETRNLPKPGTGRGTPLSNAEPKPIPGAEPPGTQMKPPPLTGSAPAAGIPARDVASAPRTVELPGSRTTNTRPAPLKAPLPNVDSILIDQDRRLAVLDGTIVTIGDAVGPRVVVQIERDAVSLREPSGWIVRIPARSRMTTMIPHK